MPEHVCPEHFKRGKILYFKSQEEYDTHMKQQHRTAYFSNLQRRKQQNQKPKTIYEEYYGVPEGD